MYLLGAHLPDHKLVRIALTNFYGISYDTARKLCARLQLHEAATVASLTDAQITQLSAFLSSPASIAARTASPTSASLLAAAKQQQLQPQQQPPPSTTTTNPSALPPSQRPNARSDPLRSLTIESDLRREVRANIAHHRTIGTYVGRRHVQGLPARGQRTRSNAQTARKLNRVERRGMATAAATKAPHIARPPALQLTCLGPVASSSSSPRPALRDWAASALRPDDATTWASRLDPGRTSRHELRTLGGEGDRWVGDGDASAPLRPARGPLAAWARVAWRRCMARSS